LLEPSIFELKLAERPLTPRTLQLSSFTTALPLVAAALGAEPGANEASGAGVAAKADTGATREKPAIDAAQIVVRSEGIRPL